MDDREVEAIIDNEREWRRYIVKKIDSHNTAISDIRSDLSGLKVWIWVGRAAVIATWGGIYTWVKSKIQ